MVGFALHVGDSGLLARPLGRFGWSRRGFLRRLWDRFRAAAAPAAGPRRRGGVFPC